MIRPWDIVKHRLVQYKKDPVTGGIGLNLGLKQIAVNATAIENMMALVPESSFRKLSSLTPTVTSGSASSFTTPWLRQTGYGSPDDWFSVFKSRANPADRSQSPSGINVTATSGPTYGCNTDQLSFMHTGQSFEVIQQVTSLFVVKVNDEYIGSTSPTVYGATTNQYNKFDFGSVGTRRIDIIAKNAGSTPLTISGINIAMTDTVVPVKRRGPVCILLGDSFLQNNISPAIAFAESLGWDDVISSGVGGTGYINTNGGAGYKWRDRIAHDVIAYAPDVVGLVGSVNDDASSASAMYTEAKALYSALKAALPSALIFAAPTATGGVRKMTTNKLLVKAAMEQAALECGVVWVDLLEAKATRTPVTGALSATAALNATTIETNLTWGLSQRLIGCTLSLNNDEERVFVKSIAQNGGVTNCIIDGGIQKAAGYASGTTFSSVGGSIWTGSGNAGATTGFGNCDVMVHSDATHPNGDAANIWLGRSLAQALCSACVPGL